MLAFPNSLGIGTAFTQTFIIFLALIYFHSYFLATTLDFTTFCYVLLKQDYMF